jgi:hypothetical protein
MCLVKVNISQTSSKVSIIGGSFLIDNIALFFV